MNLNEKKEILKEKLPSRKSSLAGRMTVSSPSLEESKCWIPVLSRGSTALGPSGSEPMTWYHLGCDGSEGSLVLSLSFISTDVT